MRILPIVAGLVCLVASAAQAQDFSDDELLSLFEAQRDAFTEAREQGTTKTRSLTLVTVENVDAPAQNDPTAPATPQINDDLPPLSQSGADGTVLTQATPELAAPGEPGSVIFGQLDPTLQINLFVKFAYDSAAIDDSQRPTLDRMCGVMKNSDIGLFQIVGHTDASGPEDYNERLSRLRAEEVSRYLINSCDIAENRLSTLGMGERFLIDASNPRADENRRVEFQALS